MAGGAGVEYYFGYGLDHTDVSCEDWRSRDESWDYCRHALAGSRNVSIGAAPDKHDWVALIRREGFEHRGKPVETIAPPEVADEKHESAAVEYATFEEKDSIVVVDLELAPDHKNRVHKQGSDSWGKGYLQYSGPTLLRSVDPEQVIRFGIKINNPGKYQFKWRCMQNPGAKKNDADNDSWLRINSDKFYGMTKQNELVGLNGEFVKVYMPVKKFVPYCKGEHHGKLEMELFAEFTKVGLYTLEISGRSTGHRLDRIFLYREGKQHRAIDLKSPLSSIVDYKHHRLFDILMA